MKRKFTLLLSALLLTSLMGFSQQVYDDFDNPEVIVYAFFDGTSFNQSFNNPATGGINSSALCGEYVRNSAVQFDVILIEPAGTAMMDDVTPYINGTKKMSVKVYSPAAGIRVQITLEDPLKAGPTNYPTGRHSEWFDTTTVANQWETLEFSLTNRPDMSVGNDDVNNMVLLFDPGSNSGATFLFDDLMGPELSDPCGGVTNDPSILDDAECQRNITYDFSNGTLLTTANPLMSGINTSDDCGKFFKFAPPQNDGAFGGALDNPFTTATYDQVSIQLYDPAAPQEFLIIFQDAANLDIIDTTFVTSNSNAWTTYTFDISSVPSSISFERIVLLLNPSTSTIDSIFYDNFVASSSVAIDDEAFASNLSIYPNPFQQNFTVSAGSPIAAVTVTDVTGKVLQRLEGLQSKEVNVDAAGYPSGLYFVTVRDMNGHSVTKKLLR